MRTTSQLGMEYPQWLIWPKLWKLNASTPLPTKKRGGNVEQLGRQNPCKELTSTYERTCNTDGYQPVIRKASMHSFPASWFPFVKHE